jgi:uncharacterized protein YggE
MKNKTFEGTLEGMGHGEVMAAPDEAIVMLDVMTQAKTAAAAVANNAERTQSVLDAVVQEPNHGISTTGLAVYPVYKYDPKTNISSIVGFRATNGVRVETKPVAAGRVFDAGVEAGANVSSGITYKIRDERPLREHALQRAVVHAFAEAMTVAKIADVRLLGPEAIAIDPIATPVLLRAEKFAADAAAPATPVIPQDIVIQANVRITFRTKVN